MIKQFRRSKRSSGNSSSGRLNISKIGPQHTINNEGHESRSLQSPKKVIKALYDYEPQGPGELKFNKGDFFHVLEEYDENKEEEHNGWCEASNPITHTRGMVPISYFEVFNRSRPGMTKKTADDSPTRTELRNSNQTLYAVTLYDFVAERDDELDVKPGENLIICAHHNYEWFIAKPINRLGGPGLVPALYVKIIDLMNPTNSQEIGDDIAKVVSQFGIPTVEEWKLLTAKYQASTIPLGSISNQVPALSSNTQYFQRESQSTSSRSSLSLQNATIVEAAVETYQLDRGRYQYLVIAKLSNGKVRYLYRYYQDFYDLQVKLLELFPYEAGKIENSKRIIPSIPGPLINVNDSISKLRREKLDYYLRNLIALPSHISRSEEVLQLFEVLDNGFDKELTENKKDKRTLKPISQKSNYQQDRLSQYSNLHYTNSQSRKSSSPTSSDSTLNRTGSSSSANLTSFGPASHSDTSFTNYNTTFQNDLIDGNHLEYSGQRSKIKAKFYYEDDIFVLLLPSNLRLEDLKLKLRLRLCLLLDDAQVDDGIHLYLKDDYDHVASDNDIYDNNLTDEQKGRLRSFEIRSSEQFHRILYEKCKLIILV